MFVMLLKEASSLCGLFFYFCACEEAKVIKAGFFLTFLEGGYQNFCSQADRNSNIIWQDCANVHARLVFLCSNMR